MILKALILEVLHLCAGTAIPLVVMWCGGTQPVEASPWGNEGRKAEVQEAVLGGEAGGDSVLGL